MNGRRSGILEVICLLAVLDLLESHRVEDLKGSIIQLRCISSERSLYIGKSVDIVSMNLKNFLSMSKIEAYPEW